MLKVKTLIIVIVSFYALSSFNIHGRKLDANEEKTFSKVNQNLIRVRNYLLERDYRIHQSVTSLIEHIDNGSFVGDPSLLFSKVDNILFYLKSHKGISFKVENNTVPFLEQSKKLLLDLKKRRAEIRKDTILALKKRNTDIKSILDGKKSNENKLKRVYKKNIQKINSKNNFFLFLMFAFAVFAALTTFFIGLFTGKKKYTTIKTKKVYKVDENFMEAVNAQALICLDKRGRVRKMNSMTMEVLEGSLAPGTKWEEYVSKYFYQDSSIKSLKGYYRNRLLPRYVFKIDYAGHRLSKFDVVQIVRFDLNELVLFSKRQVKNDFIQTTYQVFDVELDKILKTSSTSNFLGVFDLLKVQSGSELIFLNEFEAKRLVRDFLSIIQKICKNKPRVQVESFRVSRNKERMNWKVTFSGDSINGEDLTDSVHGVKYSLDMLRENYRHIIECIDLKNVYYDGRVEIQLNCVVNDLYNYVNIYLEQDNKTNKENKELRV